MRVLVACEFSGIVREAFRKKGHDAWSCDLLPTEKPGAHIQGDALEILDTAIWGVKWDLLIAHPPCTYLCVPGAHYLHKQPDRIRKMNDAREFFLEFFHQLWISRICIENPLPHKYAKLPPYSQIIQPWQFGEPYSKRTCLWLKNLPPLSPTKILQDHGERYTRKDGTTSNAKWYATASAKERARSFKGIAEAMAEQWGAL